MEVDLVVKIETEKTYTFSREQIENILRSWIRDEDDYADVESTEWVGSDSVVIKTFNREE